MRFETEDQSVIDSPPVLVSSSNVEEMIERRNPLFAADSGISPQANQNSKTNVEETTTEPGNPLFADSGRAPLSSEISEWLQEFRENLFRMKEFLNTETRTPVLLMEYLQSPHPREVWIWVTTVLILISLKTEIARSVRGPKLQGPRAEDAMAEPYFVQKILVT